MVLHFLWMFRSLETWDRIVFLPQYYNSSLVNMWICTLAGNLMAGRYHWGHNNWPKHPLVKMANHVVMIKKTDIQSIQSMPVASYYIDLVYLIFHMPANYFYLSLSNFLYKAMIDSACTIHMWSEYQTLTTLCKKSPLSLLVLEPLLMWTASHYLH